MGIIPPYPLHSLYKPPLRTGSDGQRLLLVERLACLISFHRAVISPSSSPTVATNIYSQAINASLLCYFVHVIPDPEVQIEFHRNIRLTLPEKKGKSDLVLELTKNYCLNHCFKNQTTGYAFLYFFPIYTNHFSIKFFELT